MAHFYAEIQGNRGEATRMGTPDSGIGGHIRGWQVGVRVSGAVQDGQDRFYVYKTGGSGGGARDELIACFSEDGEIELFHKPEEAKED